MSDVDEAKPLSAEELVEIEARDRGAPGPYACAGRIGFLACSRCSAGLGEACFIVRRLLATVRARDEEIARLKDIVSSVDKIVYTCMDHRDELAFRALSGATLSADESMLLQVLNELAVCVLPKPLPVPSDIIDSMNSLQKLLRS